MGHPAEPLSESPRPARSPISPRLVSLAILKENWNQGQTYLDNFLPFVCDCLRGAVGPVTVADVQQALRKRFSMTIPQAVVETLLKRTAKRGMSVRRDGTYEPDFDKLADTILTSKRDELLRCYSALIAQLRTFADERYGRVLTAGQAEDALNAYVSEFGAQTLLEGVAAREFEPTVVVEAEVEYVTHAFIEHLGGTDPAAFDYFLKVVEGNMLASVVYLPEREAVERKLTGATVYLDTPFLLRALGYAGPELQAPAVELLDLLAANDARLACFEITLSELRGVVRGAGQGRGPGGGGAVAREFHRRGLRKADREILAEQLDEALEELHVKIESLPPHAVEWTVDEAQFHALLMKRVRYQKDETLLRDLDALTAVHRLRRGQRPVSFEQSRATFLTTNARLVRASREFFQWEDGGRTWPHAMLDTDVATLMWLKTPRKAPDLPRKRIMADCYAALRPSDALWNRWLNEIDRTAKSGSYSDSQLDIMRYSPDAQRALMDMTFGAEEAVTDQTVDQVLTSAKAAITAPLEAELAEERNRREAAEAVAEETRRNSEAAAAAMAASRTELEADRKQVHSRLRERDLKRAKRWGSALFVALLVVLAGAAAVTAAAFFVPVLSGAWWLRILVGVVLVTAVIATLAGWISGWNARDFVQGRELRLAQWLHRRSLRRVGQPEMCDCTWPASE